MDNTIVLKTEDGKRINVEFQNINYEYSIDSPSIDTSELIKSLANSEITEEIIIDDQIIVDYIQNNDGVVEEFKELYKFIKNIPASYNKAVNDLLNLD